MPLAAEKLQAATSTILMWINNGRCSCEIEDFMNTDVQWKGITEAQVIEVAIANGRVCAICSKKANEAYQTQKVLTTKPITQAIENETQIVSASTGGQGSKSSGVKKQATV